LLPACLFALALGALLGGRARNHILSARENDILEPIGSGILQSRRASCHGEIQGFADIALALKAGNDPQARRGVARGVDLDRHVRYRPARQIGSSRLRQMPVILASSCPGAGAGLGSAPKVTTKDILAAVEGGRRKFLMTLRRSRIPAPRLFAMLAAGIGKLISSRSGDLDKPEVLATVCARPGCAASDAPSGSSDGSPISTAKASGPAARYEAMWNTRPSSRRPTTS